MPEQENFPVGSIISMIRDAASLPRGSNYKVLDWRNDEYDVDTIYTLQRPDGSIVKVSWDLIKENAQMAKLSQ